MSNRTFLEINHDYESAIREDPAGFVDAVLKGLSSGYPTAWLDAQRFGVAYYTMAHHSDKCFVIANGAQYAASRLATP